MRKVGDKNKKPAMAFTSLRMPVWVLDYYRKNGHSALMRRVLSDFASKKVPRSKQK